ncbi:hypothetical protein EVAR_47223_1 [Eumeta japonica]|uniref:Reverse transcriptase domain-containing protein n=1 Tax=Eumeta variegata TaxID=151549 RepID=A0A4C1XQ43_EUMVA|nr:hypothetical protein EVAR_47223_1 [Eumeta japonica]
MEVFKEVLQTSFEGDASTFALTDFVSIGPDLEHVPSVVRKITEILYADDPCFLAEFPYGLQYLVSCFYKACCKFGLKISVEKVEAMFLDIHNHETLPRRLGEDLLKQVDRFRYL